MNLSVGRGLVDISLVSQKSYSNICFWNELGNGVEIVQYIRTYTNSPTDSRLLHELTSGILTARCSSHSKLKVSNESPTFDLFVMVAFTVHTI